MTQRQHATGYRRDVLWLAALVHRLSGLLLAAFLPLHFLALGLALGGAPALDHMLAWTANPWVKLSEIALVFALLLHLLGGLRVLVIEALPWHAGHKQAVFGLASLAAAIALAFACFALA